MDDTALILINLIDKLWVNFGLSSHKLIFLKSIPLLLKI